MTPDDFTPKYKKRPVLQKARLVTRPSMLLSANLSLAGLQELDMSVPPQGRQAKSWLRIPLVKSRPAAGKLLNLDVNVTVTETNLGCCRYMLPWKARG